MNYISPTVIRAYLDKKFGHNFKIASGGAEYTINSPFERDTNFHCSINLHTGMWQDFKTKKGGSFPRFVHLVDGKDYNKVRSRLLLDTVREVGEFREAPKSARKQFVGIDYEALGYTPLNKFSGKPYMQDAIQTVRDRGLLHDNFQFYLGDGDMWGRLVIPFEKDGVPYFFQARSLDEGIYPKYKNFEGLSARHFLYPFDEFRDSLYVCEGPIDAITLQIHGLNATCTMGSSISREQIESLRQYEGRIIIAYDEDKAGEQGVNRFLKQARRYSMKNKLFRCVPKGDWNKMHQLGCNIVKHTCKETSLDLPALMRKKIALLHGKNKGRRVD